MSVAGRGERLEPHRGEGNEPHKIVPYFDGAAPTPYIAFPALLLASHGTEKSKYRTVLCPDLGSSNSGVSAMNHAGEMAKQLKTNGAKSIR
ncbi:hypothetical protein AB833_29025 [Chromatiales bacterium (ex Bugula neritina AB1)]|nr:hypothetical protein AB833_29025 [Chromatiales bacterium (ex Bugula neritina AB1)]